MSQFVLPSVSGRTVAVLGGGVLGRRIAGVWVVGGFDVTIRDPSSQQRADAVEYCESVLAPQRGKHPCGKVEAFEDLAPAVKEAWLVIEAVPEQLQLKIDTFAELSKLTAKDTILCTNSSSYKSREMVEALDESTKRRVLNMHYYMPPTLNIVELMTDGETDESIFPFISDKLKAIKMSPHVARKESTGLIFNRLWASIKREVLLILAEGVSPPEELDQLWMEMWAGHNKSGPVAMMDMVGLDTVSFIEQHYIKERNLPDTPIRFLQKYIDEGKLGNKSSKGGLLPPRPQANGSSQNGTAYSPLLYFIDLGVVKAGVDPFRSGRILVGSPSKDTLKAIVTDQLTPDGIDISRSAGKIFWTSMGIPSKNDGSIWSANLDGSDAKTIVPAGSVYTPKQLTIDHESSKIYFSDREGMRVFRCNFDGSSLEVLIQAGDWQNEDHQADCTRWCVGVTVATDTGKFYWTQKGPSKGNKGRILRANIDFLPGETAEKRSDIEVLFQDLPEPIDLEIDDVDNTLWWADRGEIPFGNSINCAKLEGLKPVKEKNASQPGKDYTLIARNLHEAIGIKLDARNRHVYTTDLGGAVYRFDMDGRNKKKFYEDEGAYTGITLTYE
ncbi:hypothetical protein HIM_01911 [Hirsutella minnesotensis 3608]|nr:hypothetical protein HIM_01911 [Hirsutella minnesotensis 3608]